MTYAEITEQHYYRARFSHLRMYIPVVVIPFAVGASFLRSVSDDGAARGLFRAGNLAMVVVGVLGTVFHWTGNFAKYRQKRAAGELPGMGATEEDRKHGPPWPETMVEGYRLGALMEVGSRGRPWLAPLSLAGLGSIGLLVDAETRQEV